MIYYADMIGKDFGTADVKAPADMGAIMNNRGYKNIVFNRPNNSSRRIKHIFIHLDNWFRVFRRVKKNDTLIYQYPIGLSRSSVLLFRLIRRIKKIKVVFLIHDIDSLRGYNVQLNNYRESFLKEADAIICHNEIMKAWLVDNDFECDRIVALGIFDYLMKDYPIDSSETNSVIVAGNLGVRKSPYLAELLSLNRKYKMNLFGPNFVNNESYTNCEYFGLFSPDELVKNLRGAFGLVWDGDSIDECSGFTGTYLQFNNPHKVSLYIAAEIPVIIWKKAALAEFIEAHNVGITINSLTELDERLMSISNEEYAEMKKHIHLESQKLRSGYYLNTSLNQVEKILGVS